MIDLGIKLGPHDVEALVFVLVVLYLVVLVDVILERGLGYLERRRVNRRWERELRLDSKRHPRVGPR